jgi:2-oxoisovalerate dehydrogenase E2 component (dihydrolipoyl transacylase)
VATKQFPLPDVGEGLTEAEILTWHVSPGDTVAVNQIIVEIETAKAAVELPCPYSGVVTELLAEPGTTVQVGTPILTIDLDPAQPGAETPSATPAGGQAPSGSGAQRSDEQVPNLVGYGPKSGAPTRRARKPAAQPQPEAPPAEAPAGEPSPAEAPAAERATAAGSATALVPLAKPPVRKLAKDLGIDLRELTGSGSGGIITREDVQRAHAVGNGTAPPTTTRDGERRVPVRGVRRATAQAMVDSAFSAPHVTEFLTVDVTPMMQLREKLQTHPAFREVKVTPLAFAAKAVCLAVQRTPEVNASWDEAAGEIVYFDHLHLGIAAATPRGLVVPKIRHAEAMSLAELAAALQALTATAREGATAPGDMVGGTFTITNVGVFGVDTGTPILNPGESAILALGAVREMPWVVDGAVVPRTVCQLALSFDHRVVDGQQGSQFLADVGALLADPAMSITY